MRTSSFTCCVLLAATGAAHADRRIEIGAALGGHGFSSSTELGVADQMDEPGPSSGALLGARLAVPLTKRLAIEGEGVVIPTKDDVLRDKATVYGVRAHARFDLLTGRFRPFLVVGAGVHVLRSTSPQMDNDMDGAYHWGGGARFALSDKIDLRVDARHLIVPDRSHDGATSDVEVTAGVSYRFGHAVRVRHAVFVAPPPAPEPVPEVDHDPDKDGLLDDADQCPLEPETRNSYKDDDGCPDQLLQDLAGIGFELDSAKIDVSSAPILERAYELLRDNAALSVEISGHTSSDGDADRNLALSLKRAEAVKAYLVKRGIAAERLLTVGHGSDLPIGDNTTPEGRVKNRRIELRIITAAQLP